MARVMPTRLARTAAATLLVAVTLPSGCGSGDGQDATTDAAATAGSTSTAGTTAERTDVSFTTSDGLTLTGYVTAGPSSPPGTPGVVLVHQFERDDLQWGDLPESLADAGYRVLAFDLRGHGDSDPYAGDLPALLTDPDGAPRDVDAAIAYLGQEGGADPTRIGVVGTSIGANLTVVASIRHQAKTFVSVSSRKPPVEALAGTAATGMRSVLYLAGETDPGGQAADAQTLHDSTADPREIYVYPFTPDHGIDLLDGADARARVLDWLASTL